MRSTHPFAVFMLLGVSACCSTGPSTPSPHAADLPPDPTVEPALDLLRPGPKRPLEPDLALDAAPPFDLHDPAMPAWIEARLANARADVPERVRLPLVRRSAAFGCDCPWYAIGNTPDNGPYHWVAVRDLTGIGIPQGPDGWTGWVDARFTGATETYRSTDAGGSDVVLPVIAVYRQARRGPDEDPVARVTPGR